MDIYNVANMLKLQHKTIHDIELRVTYYARVSTTREEQEGSIEHQIEFFTDMIKRNPHWTFVDGYVDRIRGESAANRENFMRMIDDGKAGKFDLILTKEVSRFARNTIDSLTYTRELLRSGVGVYFQNDGICTIDTDSELRLTIMSSIAADEVRKLSERVHWGQKRSIESGRVMGNNRLYGYNKVDCKLVIVEKEAEMIRLIYELYATGDYSTRKIANILKEKGYKSRSGTDLSPNTICGILQNPKYKGYYCGNKVRIIDYRTKQQKYLPEEEWVQYKDESGEIVPAIVSEELWDRCDSIFKERSIAIKNHGRSFKDRSPLTGKIYCKADGSAYWRTSYSNSVQKGDSTYQWICSSKKKAGAKSCKSFAIMEWELYGILSELFKVLVSDIDKYVDDFIELYKQTAPDNKSEINKLNQQIQALHSKKSKLLDLYMDNSLSKSDFTFKNDELDAEIKDRTELLQQLESTSTNQEQELKSIEIIKKTILDIFKNQDDLISKECIDDLIKEVIYKIEVTPISDTSMNIDVILKNGNQSSKMYNKEYRCSDTIKHLMIPQQQFTYQRNSIRKLHHRFNLIYTVSTYTL